MDNTRSLTTQYLKQQIENAGPAQQLVMMYDGAIKFLLQAKVAIERGDIQARYNANKRAMEIVSYLLETLDFEKGGEIALRLQRIYGFLLRKMMEVDFTNSAEVCDEVIGHLRPLRASWEQIARQNMANEQQATTSEGDVPVKRSAVA